MDYWSGKKILPNYILSHFRFFLLFRPLTLWLEPSENPYANPLVYTDSPLASGYLHLSNVEGLRDGSVIRVSSVGSGHIIGFADNPNFRAYWFGTNKLFANSIFFGQVINGGTAR